MDTTTTPHTEYNVIADSKKGDPDRTIVVGAHLDSVEAGPGINDNGSGSSTLLEIAERSRGSGTTPRNRLRFAFWGAEEAGLVGSTRVRRPSRSRGRARGDRGEPQLRHGRFAQLRALRLRRRPLGHPAASGGAPDGSGADRAGVRDYFARQGLETDPTAFDGRSDYGPFIATGRPGRRPVHRRRGDQDRRQAAIYGGTAGAPYDPCYHQACDTFANLNNTALDQMSDATAHAAWTLAQSSSGVTQAQAATTATKSLKFQGPFRVR